MLAFLALATYYTSLLALANPIKRAPAVYNIHPSGVPTLCLGTTQTPANGIGLYNIPCARPAGSDKAYLDFTFEPTVPGAVRVTGTDFCIDAGLGFNEHSNQQNKVQTWTLSAPGVIPPPPPPPPPPAAGKELKWNGQCLGLTIRGASDGTIVNMGGCLASTDNFKGTQLWVVPPKGTDGLIRLSGTNQCLDAGSPPLINGRILKTWTCYPGLKQQTWFHTADDHLAITGDDLYRLGFPFDFPSSLMEEAAIATETRRKADSSGG
ncbi:hypothetical protein QFC22_004643 [Naganishia vaughanmartiniae]|uniref:Uncharacterized protein n=1 Tax=Naganishia vaughanmartiniae TaxID=1424756 RepID=A0ACC2X0R6_9TREE|nr:hypothetical protein QFC22_004643 [Naganishia vaughanmartiniae]